MKEIVATKERKLTNREKFLEFQYEKTIEDAISKGFFSREEIEKEFSKFFGFERYSFISLLQGCISRKGFFVTESQEILRDRKHFQGRFGILILTPLEFEMFSENP